MNVKSTQKINKIIPDLASIAIHLSGRNGVFVFALDGADHIVDFTTLPGLLHYDSTSTVPCATLEKRQKVLNKEHLSRTKADSEVHCTQQNQIGPLSVSY